MNETKSRSALSFQFLVQSSINFDCPMAAFFCFLALPGMTMNHTLLQDTIPPAASVSEAERRGLRQNTFQDLFKTCALISLRCGKGEIAGLKTEVSPTDCKSPADISDSLGSLNPSAISLALQLIGVGWD